MLSKLYSGATVGLSAVPVEVEIDVASQGLPSITIVGLAGKAIDEAKERVRSALKNSSGDFPPRRITINLAPADLPKEGPSYDLPIAVGILTASEQIIANLDNALLFGELSLDGSLRHTKGALPLTILARDQGFKSVFLPEPNAREASIVSGVHIHPVKSLKDLTAHLMGMKDIKPYPHTSFSDIKTKTQTAEFDFSDITDQQQAKRALEIAAAGGHNIFLYGTPGAGKTMLSRAFPSILPDMERGEAVEVTKIYSITGNIAPDQTIITERPFRSPHHTTSRIGLIGGGSKPMPGEISLAHRGVLFLDEFPEFPRNIIESLRQPLEDGIVHISRAAGSVTYPASFTLIAAANPCPCGFYGSNKKPCRCLPGHITRYQKKISGPILDRIDLHVHVPEVAISKLAQNREASEPSSTVRLRVQKARDIQSARYKDTAITNNAELNSRTLKKFCPLKPQTQQLLTRAATKLNLSARAYQKIIKLSRTIADLVGESQIQTDHITEALQYRPKSFD